MPVLAKLLPVALAVAVAVGVVAEIAFTRTRTYTVAAALTDPDTVVVTVAGSVFPAGRNSYVLRDETGLAKLDTCPRWYRTVRLTPGEKVTVTGEILRNNTPPEGMLYTLAVYTIRRRDRPEIVVRTEPGKPPWASSAFIPR